MTASLTLLESPAAETGIMQRGPKRSCAPFPPGSEAVL